MASIGEIVHFCQQKSNLNVGVTLAWLRLLVAWDSLSQVVHHAGQHFCLPDIILVLLREFEKGLAHLSVEGARHGQVNERGHELGAILHVVDLAVVDWLLVQGTPGWVGEPLVNYPQDLMESRVDYLAKFRHFRMCLDPVGQVLEQGPADLRVITVQHIDSLAQDHFTNVLVRLVQSWLSQDLLMMLVQAESPLANAPNAVCHLVEILRVLVLIFKVSTHVCFPLVKLDCLDDLQVLEAHDDLNLFVFAHSFVHDRIEAAERCSPQLLIRKHLFELGHEGTEQVQGVPVNQLRQDIQGLSS